MLKVDSRDLASYVEQQRSGLLLSIIDEVRDFVFIKDTESRFLYNNRAHLENLGKTQAEVLGKNDFDVFPTELAERFYADETRLFESRIPVIKVQASISARGEKFYTTAIKMVAVNTKDDVLGLVGIVQKIAQLDAGGLDTAKQHIIETLSRQPGVTPNQLRSYQASLPGLFKGIGSTMAPIG